MGTSEKKNERNKKIDNIRALAILLVVFGHSIILYQTDWTLFETSVQVPFLDLIKRIIDLIQMPLFISVSGYLFFYSIDRYTFWELLNKRIRRLIVPYFLTALFWLLPLRFLVGYSGYAGRGFIDVYLHCIVCGEDPGHLWFLPFLFGAFVIFYITKKVIDYLPIGEPIKSALILLFGFMLHIEWWRIPQSVLFGTVFRSIALYYVWFSFGFLINKHQYTIERFLRRKEYLILILGIILVITYIIGLQSFSFITRGVLIVTSFLMAPNRSSNLSDFLSNNSFGIYLLHSPLIYITFALIPNAPPFLVVFINFVIFGGIAAALTTLIKRTKFKVLIGD